MELNPLLSKKAYQDIALVESSLAGDGKAFAKLMARYKTPVYSKMLRLVNDKDDAEDLTIEAFGKAFKNLHQYAPTHAFSTWLFRIATNNCTDFLRKKRGFQLLSLESESNSTNISGSIHSKLRSSELDPEERLIRVQRAFLMRKIVGQLKPRFRILIELRYFSELSYEEIAEKLEMPLGTVKGQLFRARQQLFKMVETSNID